MTTAHPPSARFDLVDALRGFACVWMAVFHFFFDLRVFGWTQSNFYSDPFWTWQRTCILSLFLLCAGMGQGLAMAQGQSWGKFWKRWGQIAACALLVSIATYLAFKARYVHFGVLHGIALMLILTRLLMPLKRYLGLLGLACIAVYFYVQMQIAQGLHLLDVFDTRWLNWLGLVNHKPATEDYVPLLPWLGVMLIGAMLGQWLYARAYQFGRAPALPAALRPVAQPLAQLGRWSLTFYMLHQPVLWALLWLFALLRSAAS